MATLKTLSKGIILLLVVSMAMSCAHRQPQDTGAHARAEKSITHQQPTNGDGLPERPDDLIGQQPLTKHPDYQGSGMCDMIHFDYDKSNIKDEWRECLNNVAAFFISNPNLTLIIEGHCDERGTKEYNLALGESRAGSTMSYLVNRGLDTDRIVTRSWGEDKPIALCHNESCWSQNRRAEFFWVQQSR